MLLLVRCLVLFFFVAGKVPFSQLNKQNIHVVFLSGEPVDVGHCLGCHSDTRCVRQQIIYCYFVSNVWHFYFFYCVVGVFRMLSVKISISYNVKILNCFHSGTVNM